MMQLLKSVLLAMWKDRSKDISEEVSRLSQELLSPLTGMLLSRRKGNQLDSVTVSLIIEFLSQNYNLTLSFRKLLKGEYHCFVSFSHHGSSKG